MSRRNRSTDRIFWLNTGKMCSTSGADDVYPLVACKTGDWQEIGEAGEAKRVVRRPFRSPFDTSFLERSGWALFPNASHGVDIYIWDFTRASRKPGSTDIGREKERGEGERAGLTGSSHAIRCILPTSYNSFFTLLLVSRYTRSTASRTFRGRSSHYACPIHSILANGTKALEIASVFPYRGS